MTCRRTWTGNRSCAGVDDADPPGGQPRGSIRAAQRNADRRILTPFTTVSMNHTGGKSEQGYAMEVTLDADKILATANLDGQPQSFRNSGNRAWNRARSPCRCPCPQARSRTPPARLRWTAPPPASPSLSASTAPPNCGSSPGSITAAAGSSNSLRRRGRPSPARVAWRRLSRCASPLAVCFVAAACLRKRRRQVPPGNMQGKTQGGAPLLFMLNRALRLLKRRRRSSYHRFLDGRH